MRRQTADTLEVSGDRAGAFRLDPFHLPARVDYAGKTRAGTTPQTAVIERDRVVIRRMTGAGVPLYMSVPLASYRGVLLSAAGDGVVLRLEHENGELAVPLYRADDADDVLAEWQAWSRTLGRPLLISDADGVAHDAEDRVGALIVRRPKARRVNKFFAERRPRVLCRRKVGGPATGPVHSEDEIIARDTSD
jgi:hypothetical protein